MLKLFILLSVTFLLIIFYRGFHLSNNLDIDILKNDIHHISEQINISAFLEGIKFKTICWNSNKINLPEFDKLIQHICKTYKFINSSSIVKLKIIANHSLLYEIEGSDKSLQPYLLMAHLDVVPVDEDAWTVPAFDAFILDDYIYGRGTLDDKHNVFAILETLEYALRKGFKPKRSFYIAFGHDEECNGRKGAFVIGKMLEETGITFEFILDEGLMIIQDIMPDIKLPVASIGVTEKGYLTLKISVNSTGGHSSVPPRDTSLGIIAKAVAKLEDNYHESRLGYGPEEQMLITMACEMNLFKRILFANMWLFRPLISWFLRKNPITNALISTTTAVTMFNAGIKENVISPYAEAIINHRIHPSQTIQQIIKRDQEFVDDERIKFEIISSFDPHPISDFKSSFGYTVLKKTILQTFNNQPLLVVPGIMLANTDTRHYLNLSPNIYRFSPIMINMSDVSRIHGSDERITISAYRKMIEFYYQLLHNADKNINRNHKEHHTDL